MLRIFHIFKCFEINTLDIELKIKMLRMVIFFIKNDHKDKNNIEYLKFENSNF